MLPRNSNNKNIYYYSCNTAVVVGQPEDNSLTCYYADQAAVDTALQWLAQFTATGGSVMHTAALEKDSQLHQQYVEEQLQLLIQLLINTRNSNKNIYYSLHQQ